MTTRSEREELKKELHRRIEQSANGTLETVADFIIENQKKIVEPLLRNYEIDFSDKSIGNVIKALEVTEKAILETLRLAGVE